MGDLSGGGLSSHDMGSWLDDELSNSSIIKSPSSQEIKSVGKKCSACGNTLATGAVLCVACGYDTRSGKKHKTKKVLEDRPSKSKAVAVAKHSATLMRGALFSAIGAAMGAAIWVAVVYATGLEIGYIAIGLGFAAGAGMAAGHEDNNGTIAGMVAGGISILGIVGAKFFIYQHLATMTLGSDTFEALGENAAEYEIAMNLALQESISFADMFGPIDGLFILFAVASAYQVGSGQMTD